MHDATVSLFCHLDGTHPASSHGVLNSSVRLRICQSHVRTNGVALRFIYIGFDVQRRNFHRWETSHSTAQQGRGEKLGACASLAQGGLRQHIGSAEDVVWPHGRCPRQDLEDSFHPIDMWRCLWAYCSHCETLAIVSSEAAAQRERYRANCGSGMRCRY